MKKIFFTLALFITAFSFGQNLQNANWCFGYNAGVNFNSTPTPFWSATPTTPIYNNITGEASVSDENGVLQFYTDGLTVWNKDHAVMPNGTDLYGFSDMPSLQKVVIVPKPNYPKIYYVFTVGFIYTSPWGPPAFGKGGIHYTIVDMTTGLGHVDPVIKNIPLLNHNGVPIEYDLDYTYTSPVHITEHSRMTTSLHASGDKIWLSFMADYEQFNSGNHQRYFYNYLITENGIMFGTTGSTVPDSVSPRPTVAILLDNVNYPYTPGVEYRGVMKVSPNRQLLADGEEGVVNLYNYNSFTGDIILTSHQTIYAGGQNNFTGWGLEFSPNSLLLYFSVMGVGIYQDGITDNKLLAPSPSTNYHSLIYQYSIETENPELIYSYPVVPNLSSSLIPVGSSASVLQLGMDNRIYVTNYGVDNNDRLGVITVPNAIGTMCGFDPNGLLLTPVPNTFHNASLPQWVHKAVINYWPKVYYTWYPQLSKDKNGNLFAELNGTGNLNENINHRGILPPPPNNDIYYTFPFGNSGVTTWTKTNLIPLYILNSGDLQLGQYVNGLPIPISYCNGANGNTVPPPVLVPANDRILAETSAGGFITQNGNSIYLRTNSGTTSIVINTFGNYLPFFKFNPSTNRLYVLNDLNSFKVYDIISNAFVPVSGSPNYTNLWVVQIDNQDRVFTYTVNGLEQYNYLNNTFNPVSISGFANSSVFPMQTLNPYTEDKIITIHSAINKMYAIDFSTMSAKNATATGEYHVESFTYAFVGNDVYIATSINPNSTVFLGTQSISALPNTDQQTSFIAKLNLNIDFSSFQSISNNEKKPTENSHLFKVLITPNPITGTTLNLKITETVKQISEGYSINITNRSGRVVIQKASYLSDTPLNIGNLEKGIYYVEIINRKGERVAKSFVKL